LLHEEEVRRKSTDVQQKMAAAEESGTSSWITVAERLQHQVCVDYGIDPTLGLSLIRSPIHPSLKSISLYRRNNRTKICSLSVGQPFPSSVVVIDAASGKPVPLASDRKTGFELVVTGSFT
jgi:hypothetical protein